MEPNELAVRLHNFRIEHRDLDFALDAIRAQGTPDQLQAARLKKRKLRLKDEIMRLETMQIPDIIA
ncbi:DUF465 domain-containing protein [Sphingomonas sp.]|uniref:YdcH family protein n=1 Tax=Sphingomonas sp. TaxID=28214 RepID=UPI0026014444|nr:DUF465 domain-containing protein [Sphingomonas sp.]